jgi:hypothetical protein
MDPRNQSSRPEPADYVPLVHLRRASVNKNVWNDDEDEQEITTSRTLTNRNSIELFHYDFADNEVEEDVHDRVEGSETLNIDPDTRLSVDDLKQSLIPGRRVSAPNDVLIV